MQLMSTLYSAHSPALIYLTYSVPKDPKAKWCCYYLRLESSFIRYARRPNNTGKSEKTFKMIDFSTDQEKALIHLDRAHWVLEKCKVTWWFLREGFQTSVNQHGAWIKINFSWLTFWNFRYGCVERGCFQNPQNQPYVTSFLMKMRLWADHCLHLKHV